jgi:quinol monooxygenase YgiN
MTTIAKGQPVVTLMNVFTVEPENQQRLVDLLIQATQEVMDKLPGYVSANIHKGLDGKHVANYAQWRNKEAYEAMLQNPEVQKHIQKVLKIATAAPYLYEVAFVDDTPSK